MQLLRNRISGGFLLLLRRTGRGVAASAGNGAVHTTGTAHPADVQPPVQTPQAQPPAGQKQKPAGCVRFLAVLIMLTVVIMVISMVVNLFGILFDRFFGGRAEVSSEAGGAPL